MPSLREHIEKNTGEPYDPIGIALRNYETRKELEAMKRINAGMDTIGITTALIVAILFICTIAIQAGMKIGTWWVSTLAGV